MSRRHELQKNELADWLEEKIEDLRPYFPAISIGGLLALALVLGVWWYSTQQSQASAASWNQYFSALGEREQDEALQKVIESEKSNEAANWARQTLADTKLARGAAAVFTDREASKKQLEEAAELYTAIRSTTSDPLLRSRATFGLARAQESLFNVEGAKKLYEEVAQANSDSVIGEEAQAAVKRLSDPRDVELLNWLAKQTPKRPTPTPTGRPGGVPGLPSDLPDRPDIGLPDFGGPIVPENEKTPSGLSFPAPGDAPATDVSASDAPASDAPATEKPAGDAPPAETPPPSDDAPAEKTEDPPPSEEAVEKSPPAPAEGDTPPADEGTK